MQEDFIEDDFLEEEGNSSNRPFLIAAGVLVSSLILMGICTAFFLLNNRAAEYDAEVAARQTRNAETLDANAAALVSLTETAEAMPTNTPEPTAAPTDTPAPNTPTPTSTPVIEDKNGEITVDGSGEDGEGTAEDNGDTAAADDEENGDGTTGSKDDGDAAATPISALNETGNGSNDALPETG
ncbi:hypothetical protein MNBD_CHLOROFLEXI01-3582, partial [hydrothermal vent metagenome]